MPSIMDLVDTDILEAYTPTPYMAVCTITTHHIELEVMLPMEGLMATAALTAFMVTLLYMVLMDTPVHTDTVCGVVVKLEQLQMLSIKEEPRSVPAQQGFATLIFAHLCWHVNSQYYGYPGYFGYPYYASMYSGYPYYGSGGLYSGYPYLGNPYYRFPYLGGLNSVYPGLYGYGLYPGIAATQAVAAMPMLGLNNIPGVGTVASETVTTSEIEKVRFLSLLI
uniref:Uncharacterized protein n=1 Tax=Ascaris lumbricoides TaxID=6252 RepID=A0A0M3IFQ7_ASCLU